MKADIVRISTTPKADAGVFSAFLLNDRPFCVSLEPEWRDNKQNISCIPADVYLCRRHKSPHFGETFKIMDVPDRSEVLFHPGNVMADTKACVLLAESYGKLYGELAVLNSGKTFKRFMEYMESVNEFVLRISWAPNIPITEIDN